MCTKFLYTSLIILSLFGCSSASRNQSSSTKTNEQLNEKLNLNIDGNVINKIVFLTFEITMTDSVKDFYTIRLKNTISADGVLKKSTSDINFSPEPNYLYYQISKDQNADSNFEKVHNPLYMIYEYPADNGVLGKQIFRKKSGEFVIRFQYEKDLKYISVFKPGMNSKSLKKIYHAAL